ncbi:hypothetical protein JNW88_00305 [Micromonospora sp. ATA32]|nr:hypothetical protein [Micromonospora sp. ATA32]
MSTPAPKGSPNGARKCGDAGHRNKGGKRCAANAIAGTDACRNHAGKPLAQAKAEGAIRLEVRQWMLDHHNGSQVDPRSMLLNLIAFWRWKTNRYGQLLGEAYEAAERLREAHGAGALLVAPDGGDADGDGSEHPAVQAARATWSACSPPAAWPRWWGTGMTRTGMAGCTRWMRASGRW